MKNLAHIVHKGLLGVILLTLSVATALAQSSASTNFIIRIDPVFKLSAFTYPSPVTINLSVPSSGGSVTPGGNSNMYLRLTSVAPTNSTHRITAELTTNPPAGTILKVIASNPTCPTTQGYFGTPLPTITLLRNISTTLIDGIKSCYSGTGNSDGYRLSFSWYPDYANYALIRASSAPATVEVKFTLTSSL